MKVIGITGGVGCGKSTVLDYLEKHYPCAIVRSDDVGKRVMEPGNKCFEEVVLIFGDDILTPEGEIDRPKLASIVFQDPKKRMVLNSIVHPAVRDEIIADLTKKRIEGRVEYYFLETAILYEVHYDTFCDEVWYIYADEASRRERLQKQRGYSNERMTDMMASQQSEEFFKSHADHVIDNSQSLEETAKQLRLLLA
ncbi:MAG: dephospho-CoA kinase [Lachnospiraceae bacterium]|nr:dephospho-CoA kinase [Lachnospiraceae bacterium]